MDAFGFVDLMKKIGVERRLLVAGDNKGLLDPFLPESPEQKAHLQTMLDQVHQHFITAVKTGRGDRLQQAPELFSGLVWSGEEALGLGLVDEYGNTRSVASLFEAEQIIDFTPRSELLDRIAERIGTSAGRGIGQYLLGNFSLE